MTDDFANKRWGMEPSITLGAPLASVYITGPSYFKLHRYCLYIYAFTVVYMIDFYILLPECSAKLKT